MVAVLNYDGAGELFSALIAEAERARDAYTRCVPPPRTHLQPPTHTDTVPHLPNDSHRCMRPWMGTAERQLVLRVMNGAQAPVDPLLLQAIISHAYSSA